MLSMLRRKRVIRGQSTIEYAMLITLVAAAVVAMQVYVRRSTAAALKVIEEQMNAEPE